MHTEQQDRPFTKRVAAWGSSWCVNFPFGRRFFIAAKSIRFFEFFWRFQVADLDQLESLLR